MINPLLTYTITDLFPVYRFPIHFVIKAANLLVLEIVLCDLDLALGDLNLQTPWPLLFLQFLIWFYFFSIKLFNVLFVDFLLFFYFLLTGRCSCYFIDDSKCNDYSNILMYFKPLPNLRHPLFVPQPLKLDHYIVIQRQTTISWDYICLPGNYPSDKTDQLHELSPFVISSTENFLNHWHKINDNSGT